MPASKNTYIGGLDRNTSQSKYQNTKYYDAKNIKVITEGGLSTGSIENEKGNKFSFSLPDLPRQFVITPNSLSSELKINFAGIGNITISNVEANNVYQALTSNATVASLITSGDIEVIEVGDTAIVYDLSTVIGFMSPEYMADGLNAATDLKIIGHGMLHDDIILFTTSSTDEDPNGTDGQIWKLKYDEINGTVKDINGTKLDRNVHLLNNSKLDFSTNFRIEEAVCRYENIKTGRVYFTDYNNALRTFNAFADDILVKHPSEFDIVDSVSMSSPVIDGVSAGTWAAGSVLQFGYRLVNTSSGTITTMSPCSSPIQLTEYDPDLDGYHTYQGSEVGAASNSKSVTYTIKDIDTDYNLIEHFAIAYSYQDNPTIVKFGEESVPSTGEMSVTSDGSEDFIYFTAAEFNLLNQSFVAKTLTSIDDRLVAANIKQADFDVDFDARAYRFSSGSNVLKLHDTNNNETAWNTTIPSFSWSDVPEDHDAINYYNQQYPEFYLNLYGGDITHINDWKNLYQKKFQQGSTSVLGGTGKNISYKFITRTFSGNENLANPTTTPADHITVTRYGSGDGPSNLGTVNADGTLKEYSIANQFKNQKSPLISTTWTGYARGETYRFGITFFDLKGNPSYVKWIGDIKFPSQYDNLDSDQLLSPWQLIDTSSSIVAIKNIAIEFTVDISSLIGEISGFSIVRAERKEKDKTRLGTGIISQFEGSTNISYDDNLYASWRKNAGDTSYMGVEFDSVDTNSNQKCLTISDTFSQTRIFQTGGGNSASYSELINFRSPLSQFRNYNNYNPSSTDWLQPTETFINSIINCYNNSGDKAYGFYMKVTGASGPTNAERNDGIIVSTGHLEQRIFLIDSEKELKPGEAVSFTDSIFSGFDNTSENYDYLINAYPTLSGSSTNKGKVLGLGNNTHLLRMKEPNSVSWSADPLSLFGSLASIARRNGFKSTNWLGPQFAPTLYNERFFTCVSYNRFLNNQYGGWSYLQRSKTKYIETGHYQIVSDLNGTSFTSEVWGGDTYVTYHDEEIIVPYSNENHSSTQSFDAPVDKRVAIAVVYPAETSINTHLRIGEHWAKSKDYTTDWLLLNGTEPFESLEFNEVYNQQSNIKSVYLAKDPIAPEVQEFPHMVKVSEAKIDGELIDNWATFKPLVFDEVEGIHGPINKIIAFRNALLFYQTHAIGSVIINERVAIPNEVGDAIVLGNGSVINKPSYITKETGTLHQYSVISTPMAVYHYDDVRRKIYKYGGQMMPVSDIKHMSSYFHDIKGNLIQNDKTLQSIGKGVHATYDYKNNRAIFTFLGIDTIRSWESGTFYPGEIIIRGGIYYLVNSEFTYTVSDKFENPQTPDDFDTTTYSNLKGDFKNGFTITYNEMIDSFESFMDYVPQIYLDCNRRLLTVDSEAKGHAYVQDEGTYGEFYGVKYDSHVELLINPHADYTKVFDNIEFKAEIRIDDVDQPTETLSSLQFYNDYQDTGVIPLVVGTNIVQRMRTWRARIPRHTGTKARMRDSHIRIILKFENDNDKRLVLHDIITHFRVANM